MATKSAAFEACHGSRPGAGGRTERLHSDGLSNRSATPALLRRWRYERERDMRYFSTLLPLTAFAWAAVCFAEVSHAQATCTDKSSPRECYETGLAQVGTALAEFRNIERDLEQIKKTESTLRTELDSAKSDLKILKAFQQQLATLGNFVVSGNRVRCDRPWSDSSPDDNASIATCPSDSTLLSGGCDMTCLSMDHLSSVPNPPGPNANGWKCRHAPQQGPMLVADTHDNRTHSALALCQKKPKE
jgi:hypothetical protein